nr:YhbP family protein [Winslowiella toletana]
MATIGDYLQQQHVLTLCSGERDSLWCASCFYVFDRDEVAFLLMSASSTEHGALMQQQALVAGTVSDQTKTVALIRGVQYQGEVSCLSGDEAQRARTHYQRRFPLAKLITTPVWKIRINRLKMTNNRLGFGRKLHWLRNVT